MTPSVRIPAMPITDSGHLGWADTTGSSALSPPGAETPRPHAARTRLEEGLLLLIPGHGERHRWVEAVRHELIDVS